MYVIQERGEGGGGSRVSVLRAATRCRCAGAWFNLKQSAHLLPHPTPPDFTHTHAHTRAAAPPQVNFIKTPDLPGRTLGDPVDYSAPPPSSSTPSSVPQHSTRTHYSPFGPLGGAEGLRTQTDDGVFGDEATNAIAELNTPSPVPHSNHKVRTRSKGVEALGGACALTTLRPHRRHSHSCVHAVRALAPTPNLPTTGCWHGRSAINRKTFRRPLTLTRN